MLFTGLVALALLLQTATGQAYEEVPIQDGGAITGKVTMPWPMERPRRAFSLRPPPADAVRMRSWNTPTMALKPWANRSKSCPP